MQKGKTDHFSIWYQILSALFHFQSFVVAEAYDYSPDWAEMLYQKVILKGDFSYLDEFKLHRPLPASLFEEISKKWASII